MGDLNAIENLILLCPTHHAEVDDKDRSQHYSAENLRNIKDLHLQSIRTFLTKDNHKIQDDIVFLNNFMKYTSFCYIKSYLNDLPMSFNVNISIPLDTYNNIKLDFPNLYPLHDKKFNLLLKNFIDSCYKLYLILSGYATKDGNSKQIFTQAVSIHRGENYCYIRKNNLSYTFYDYVIKLINELKERVERDYNELMVYIKNISPEVILNSWQFGPRI